MENKQIQLLEKKENSFDTTAKENDKTTLQRIVLKNGDIFCNSKKKLKSLKRDEQRRSHEQVNATDIPSLLSRLRQEMKNTEFQVKSWRLLWESMAATQKTLSICVNFHVELIIADSIQHHFDDFEVMLQICHVIKSYAASDTTTSLCGRAGLVPVVVKILVRHFDHENVLEQALGALWNLMANNPTNKMACVNSGAVESSVEIIKAYIFNSRLVELAAGALRKFVAFKSMFHYLCITAGGVEALLLSLNEHLSKAQITLYCCATLADMLECNQSVHDLQQQLHSESQQHQYLDPSSNWSNNDCISTIVRSMIDIFQLKPTIKVLIPKVEHARVIHNSFAKAKHEIQRFLSQLKKAQLSAPITITKNF